MSAAKHALSFRLSRHGKLIREVTLRQAVIKIGKVPSAHLQIDDESVSRMHAIVEVARDGVILIDLGSTRGTFVNGQRINRATLRSGDVITLGDTEAELVVGEAAAVAAPVAPPVAPVVTPVAAVGSAPVAVAAAPPLAKVIVALPPPLPAVATAPVAPRAVATGSTPPPLPGGLAAPAVASPSLPSVRPAVPPPASVALPALALAAPVADALDALDAAPGTGAVEVAAMLGDAVIDVKHCMDPRGGRRSPLTWALLGVGAASLATAAIVFAISLVTAADNARRLAAWLAAQRPAWAFRPTWLGAGLDAVAISGVALGLVCVVWALLRSRRERGNPYYRIGSAPGVELAVAGAPLPAFPLIAPAGDAFVFHFGDGIDGELIVGGAATPLAELAATGRARPSPSIAGAIEVPIPHDARIRARAGLATFLISAVARPRRHAAPLLARVERRTAAFIVGSLAVHLGVLGLLRLLPPTASVANHNLADGEDQRLAYINVSANDPVAPRPPDGAGDGGDVAKAGNDGGGPEGMALPGIRDDRGPRPLALQVAQNADPETHDAAIERARHAGFVDSDRLTTSLRGLTGSVSFDTGFDPDSQTGVIDGGGGGGGGGGDGHGFGGGRGNSGMGTCGDGMCGWGSSQVGRYDTTASFVGPYGPRGPGLRPHHPEAPALGPPKISTTYDKQTIRRYIRQHLAQLTYCYEKQLLAHPTLGGDITATFLISPQGPVVASKAQGFDGEVASCIAGVIQAIEFPAPGGESVQVNYPFHFHAPGT